MCESSSLMPPSPSPPRPRRLPGQPPEYKHFCRVCNKGFTCGSALGGHMRAHGASDVVDGFGAADDDDSPADEAAAASARCRGGGDDQCEAAATHAYALRANSNRLIRSCQVCKNCGKEFTSWELFLQHGKCNSEDEEEEEAAADDGLLGSLRSSSPSSNGGDAQEDPAVVAAWSKGKRSRRVNLMVAGEDHSTTPAAAVVPSQRGVVGGTSGEEEDLANCLVMLSSSSNIVEQPNVARMIDQQEPCASTSKLQDDERLSLQPQPISFFAPPPKPAAVVLPSPQYIPPASSRTLFECKACKKVFTSHQALGGHRASHKKVKGCFAAKFDTTTTSANDAAAATTNPPTNNGNNSKGAATVEQANNVVVGANADDRTRGVYGATAEADSTVGTTSDAVASASLSMALAPLGHDPLVTTLAVAAPGKKNTKMHECSVCHRLFSSGQALGGHKRCHWLTSSTADPCNPVANMVVPPLTEDLVGVVRHQLTLRPAMVDAPEPVLDLTIAGGTTTTQPEAGSSSCFRLDAIAPVHLQPLAVAVPSSASHRKKTTATSSHHATAEAVAEDDEADSTAAKRAKLSDLKDVVSMDGEPTEPWLQVGIGSSSAGGDDKSRNSAT